jgi:hypothetical protein
VWDYDGRKDLNKGSPTFVLNFKIGHVITTILQTGGSRCKTAFSDLKMLLSFAIKVDDEVR